MTPPDGAGDSGFGVLEAYMSRGSARQMTPADLANLLLVLLLTRPAELLLVWPLRKRGESS